MKYFILLFVLISTNYIFPCDWEVIKYEPETYIYNITPMNDTELVSYSYDGFGNMFYQYSSDNGSTWEVIREEMTILFEYQPEQVVNVLKVNQNTILFFRFHTQVLSYNIETKQWDSTYTNA